AVERGAQCRAGARADHVADNLFKKCKLLRAGVERDEVRLRGACTLLKELARDLLGIAATGVLAVGDDEQVLAEDAGAMQVRPRFVERLADRSPAARARQAGERRADRGTIVGGNRTQRSHVA